MDVAVLAALLAVTILMLQAIYVVAVWPHQSLVKRTVLVTLHDGVTLRGVIDAEHSDRIALKGASRYADDGSEIAMSGVVHVPRSNVSYLQEVVLTAQVQAGDR